MLQPPPQGQRTIGLTICVFPSLFTRRLLLGHRLNNGHGKRHQPSGDLHQLMISTRQQWTKETKDQALDSFWGPVLAETIPTHIYIEGAYFKNKSAGGGIYFGPGSPMNTKLLLSMLERPTADLARLVAIQEAVTMVPPDRSLLIFCTSKYMIRQLCYSTAKNNKED
jgi:hypothetical protein